jgi:hypothetical protein
MPAHCTSDGFDFPARRRDEIARRRSCSPGLLSGEWQGASSKTPVRRIAGGGRPASIRGAAETNSILLLLASGLARLLHHHAERELRSSMSTPGLTSVSRMETPEHESPPRRDSTTCQSHFTAPTEDRPPCTAARIARYAGAAAGVQRLRHVVLRRRARRGASPEDDGGPRNEMRTRDRELRARRAWLSAQPGGCCRAIRAATSGPGRPK